MYRIEFTGHLLEGFDPQFVRMEVGIRLRLRDEQVERLFSGQTVVLKKAISEKNSQAYMDELRSLGLDAKLVPLEVSEPTNEEGTIYKVVFWGRVLPGFDRTIVMAAVAKRLKLPPAQLMQIFSGVKVVLKRGVSAERGARLVVDLARLGMQIELEMDAPAAVMAAKPTPTGVPVLPSAATQEDDPQYGALLRTACDLSGTPFSGYDMSSTVASEEAPPPAPVKVGYAAANTDGYVNCGNCGFYQQRSAVCKKCGSPIAPPVPRVAQINSASAAAPTILVRAEATREVPREPTSRLKRRKRVAPSLHTLMQTQEDEVRQTRSDSGYHVAIITVLLVLGGVIAYLLMRH